MSSFQCIICLQENLPSEDVLKFCNDKHIYCKTCYENYCQNCVIQNKRIECCVCKADIRNNTYIDYTPNITSPYFGSSNTTSNNTNPSFCGFGSSSNTTSNNTNPSFGGFGSSSTTSNNTNPTFIRFSFSSNTIPTFTTESNNNNSSSGFFGMNIPFFGSGFTMNFRNSNIPTNNTTRTQTTDNEVITYHPNGRIHERYRTINGSKFGTYEKYYPNGKLCIKCNYVNNTKMGLYESYYENGNIQERTNYIGDIIMGMSEKYDINGNLIESRNIIGNMNFN